MILDGSFKKSKLTKFREDNLISKAELSRKAGISPITLNRIETGYTCRIDKKRKILEALGIDIRQKGLVFGEE